MNGFNANQAIVANGSGVATSFTCPVGQVLGFDASGFATCTTVAGANAFVNNGNSFAGLTTIGTNDVEHLVFETSNTERMRIDRTTGNVGIGTNGPNALLDNAGSFALSGDITPAEITANTNDYAPTGLAGASVLRLDTDASRDLTGLTGGVDGRKLTIVNVGTTNLVLKDENGSSTAANRFALASDITLAQDQSVDLVYDSTASRWRAVGTTGSGGSGGASQWTTSGSDIYYNTGKVGIGTTSASYPLEVNGGGVIDDLVKLRGGGNGSTIHFYNSSDSMLGVVGSDTGGMILGSNTGNIALNTSSTTVGWGTTRMLITNGGNVGIGTTSPNTALDLNGALSTRGMAAPAVSPAGQGRIYFDSTANKFRVSQNNGAYQDLIPAGGTGDILNGGNTTGAAITVGTNDNFAFNVETNGTTRMIVDNTGNVGIGINPSSTINGYTSKLATAGSSANWMASYSVHVNNSDAANLAYTKSRNTTVGAHTIVQNNDNLGDQFFYGSDGSTYQEAAIIRASVDGTPGVSDMPGRLTFWTSADGTAAAAERMRITNSGNVGIGTTSPNTALDLNGALSTRGMAAPAVSPAGQGRIYFDSTANKFRVSQNNGAYQDLIPAGGTGDILNGGNTTGAAITVGTNDNFAFNVETNGTTRMSVDNTGNVGIGTASPNSKLQVSGGAIRLDGNQPIEFGNSGEGIRTDGNPDIKFYSRGNVDIFFDADIVSGASDSFNVYGSQTSAATTGALFTIKDTGNVGIGASSPGAKLDVTSAANAIAIQSTGYSLTGTNAQSLMNLTGTWNTTGVPTLIKANVTDTASNASSLLMDLQVGGVSKFNVDKTGKITGDGSGLTGISGAISGLTTGYVPKATGATAIGNSLLYDDGTNVGVGTATPSARIHSFRSTAAGGSSITGAFSTDFNNVGVNDQNVIRLENINGGGGSVSNEIRLQHAGTNRWGIGNDYNVSGGQDFYIYDYINSQNRIFINSTGQVGIGTIAPGALLQLGTAGTSLGTLRMTGNTSGYVQLQPAAAAGSWTMTLPATAGTNGYVLQTDGAGVTSWVAPSAGASSSGTAGHVQFSNGSGGFSSDTSQLFWDATNNRLGIGGAAPSYPLHVLGGSGATSIYSVGNIVTSGDLRFDSTATGLIWNSNGLATDAVHVAGGAGNNSFLVLSSNTNVGSATTGDYIKFNTNNGTERMRIISDGSVGIGTTSPGAKLDVTDTSTTTSAIIVPRAAGAFTGTNVNGMIRYNTTSTLFEFRQNGAWVNYTTVSDGRLKTNVKPVTNGLDVVKQLKPVYYDWDRSNPKATSFQDKHQVGFIAQDVEKVLPEVVNKGEDSYRSMEYDKMVAVAIAAIKELYAKVMGIKADQAVMTREIATVKAETATKANKAEVDAKTAKIEADNKAKDAKIKQLEQENAAQAKQLGAMKAYLCAKDPKAVICK